MQRSARLCSTTAGGPSARLIPARRSFRGPQGPWADFAPLEDVFTYDGSGVMPGRTWVIAPDRASLNRRWEALKAESDSGKKKALFHPHLRDGKPGDKHLHKSLKQGLYGHEFRTGSVASDNGAAIRPARYGFRSFDRQWIIPDGRLINQPNPTLWKNHSKQQVYLTALQAHALTAGPAVTFSAEVPDLHHYNGRGGRVFPLWAGRRARKPNLKAALLDEVAGTLGVAVGASDLMAYLAAVAAHPAYTARFRSDLVQPGLRFPMTADASLFAEAVNIGREVIWLHCFGERFADPMRVGPAARRACRQASVPSSRRTARSQPTPTASPIASTTMPLPAA